MPVFVVPAAFDEVSHIALRDADPAQRDLAHRALGEIKKRSLLAAELTDLQSVIARSLANKLLVQGVVPPEEWNDALILAEASMLDCQLLISSDSHLRDADPAQLALVLRECHAHMVVVRKPAEIVRQFAGR